MLVRFVLVYTFAKQIAGYQVYYLLEDGFIRFFS